MDTTIKPLVSILMSTYNDREFISAAVSSVLDQSYANWELIIIDDGSNYDVLEVLKQFDDPRIKYLRQENSGLNVALLNGSGHIKGDYVTILASDDFISPDALKDNLGTILKYKADGVFCDLIKVNKDGRPNGLMHFINKFSSRCKIDVLMRYGSNIVPDIFFVKRSLFDSDIMNNFILWNTPYWLNSKSLKDAPRLIKTSPWYYYRVYQGNYLRSDIGKFMMVNGCLRSCLTIASEYYLPLHVLQRLFWGGLFKLLPYLKNYYSCIYHPIYLHQKTKTGDLGQITDDLLKMIYGSNIPQNIYYQALSGFYKNYPSGGEIYIKKEENAPVFIGKDIISFYHLLLSNRLPKFYVDLLSKIKTGAKVFITDGDFYNDLSDIIKFLNIPIAVKIKSN